jgi:hypothetical protein
MIYMNGGEFSALNCRWPLLGKKKPPEGGFSNSIPMIVD